MRLLQNLIFYKVLKSILMPSLIIFVNKLGSIVEELQLTINEWISQIVRVYSGENRIEFSWIIGPIDIK